MTQKNGKKKKKSNSSSDSPPPPEVKYRIRDFKSYSQFRQYLLKMMNENLNGNISDNKLKSIVYLMNTILASMKEESNFREKQNKKSPDDIARDIREALIKMESGMFASNMATIQPIKAEFKFK
jgi:hypothetical protein